MQKVLILLLSVAYIQCQRTSTSEIHLATSLILSVTNSSVITSVVPATSASIYHVSALSSSSAPEMSSAQSLNNSSVYSTQQIMSSSSANLLSTASLFSKASLRSTESLNSTANIQPSSRGTPTASTVVVYSSSVPSSTPTPTSKVAVECGSECKLLKKRLYTAAVFAILFLIVSAVLGVLLYRQYQITKDYKDDPSLSRLI